MSLVNFGSQVVLWNYGTEYKSLIFGRLLDGMNIEGILSGLDIIISSSTSITINPGVVIIKNRASDYTTNPVTMKIHFTNSFLLTITAPAILYVGLRYEYESDEVSYAYVVTGATTGSFEANDIVIAKLGWTGSAITSISYFNTDYSVLKNLDKRVNKVKFAIDVGASGNNDTIKLAEDAHLLYNDNGYWNYTLVDSSSVNVLITATSGDRVDLVYYDTLDSSLKVVESSSITLVTTSIPLLLISRMGDRNDITTDDFIYIN